jgi:hypothetical protein
MEGRCDRRKERRMGVRKARKGEQVKGGKQGRNEERKNTGWEEKDKGHYRAMDYVAKGTVIVLRVPCRRARPFYLDVKPVRAVIGQLYLVSLFFFSFVCPSLPTGPYRPSTTLLSFRPSSLPAIPLFVPFILPPSLRSQQQSAVGSGHQ